MQQYELEEFYISEKPIQFARQIYHEMRDIKNWNKEVFVAFFLDAKSKIISREIIHIGTVDCSIVHPRELFRTAILRNASSVIISHNHPSGDCNPSQEDIKTTKRFKEAGEIIGIGLLDHVIVSKDGFFSFSDEGMD